MYNATRNDVKALAMKVEVAAKQVQEKLDSGADFFFDANELVRHATTMTFAMGEVYALEQSAPAKKAKAPKAPQVYNRDSRGRFARKI